MKTEVEEERWKNKKNKLWQKEKKGTENRKKKKKIKNGWRLSRKKESKISCDRKKSKEEE